MSQINHTEVFDHAIQTVTQERGEAYGHPLDDFKRVATMKTVIDQCPDDEVRHALVMIAVKIGRLVETPDHLDSVIDIAGYARTIAMVLDEKQRLDACSNAQRSMSDDHSN